MKPLTCKRCLLLHPLGTFSCFSILFQKKKSAFCSPIDFLEFFFLFSLLVFFLLQNNVVFLPFLLLYCSFVSSFDSVLSCVCLPESHPPKQFKTKPNINNQQEAADITLDVCGLCNGKHNKHTT